MDATWQILGKLDDRGYLFFSTGSSAQTPQWKVQQVTQPYSKALREATDTKFASVEEWLRWSELPPKNKSSVGVYD